MANGFNALFAFIASVVAARLLAPHDFGSLSLMLATSLFLALSLDFGMNQILTRRAALRRDSRLFRNILQLRVACALAVTAAGIGYFVTVHHLTSNLFLWGLVGASTAWQLVFSTEQALWQGMQNFTRLALCIITINGARLMLLAVTSFYHPSLESLLLAYTLPSILMGLFTALRWNSLFQLTTRYRLIRQILPTIALAGITVFLAAMMSRIGIWMVTLMAGIAVTASYAVAYQMASLVLTLGSALAVYSLPHITQLDRDGDAHEFFVSYLRRAIPVLLLLIVAAGIFSLLVPNIFGKQYHGTGTITFLLMVSFLLSILNSPFYLVQQSRLRYGFLIKVHFGQVCLLVAGCAALVPEFGGMGAAMADLFMRVATVIFFISTSLGQTQKQILQNSPAFLSNAPATKGREARDACGN